jgi:RNA polymerase sigma-70 factor (ECF subfamily)
MLTSPTDIELMVRAQGDDVAAFHELVRRYREPLRRFFAATLPDRAQAEDYAQETFLRLWLARSRYEPTGKFSTYLFQIGRHYWLNQRKKVRPEVGLDGLDEGSFAVAPAVTRPEAVMLERYRVGRMRRAIAALPDHYRAVFEMSHFEGLKYAQISCRLGIPIGTVKSRMAEAVRRLRQSLTTSEE